MYQPRAGERVWVHPTNPSESIQRAATMFGQFLTHSWQECTWDEFLNARLHDGSILVSQERPGAQPLKSAEKEVPLPASEPISFLVESEFA